MNIAVIASLQLNSYKYSYNIAICSSYIWYMIFIAFPVCLSYTSVVNGCKCNLYQHTTSFII